MYLGPSTRQKAGIFMAQKIIVVISSSFPYLVTALWLPRYLRDQSQAVMMAPDVLIKLMDTRPSPASVTTLYVPR